MPLPVTGASRALAAPASLPSARLSFAEVLRARQPRPPAAPSSPASRLFASVERAQARLDATLAQARRGRVFTGGELLALQADAYRAGQTIEIASRAVEQAAQSVRQAVNTQV
jgi:hypothetical protein